eukprot:GGOE01034992.1.p1 GENE.GGOE01034992.1~~GGOE01034992.1.p1  ORF type:complete len:683 (-),score=239.65 GGOE01034992.1:312-2279(-)
MEAEFQAQMDAFVGKTFTVWGSFLFLLFSLLLVRCYTYPRATFMSALPYVLILILLFCFLTLTNCYPSSKRFIPTVLPLVCTAIVGLIAWAVHVLVKQCLHNALDLTLANTMELIAGNAEAERELTSFARNQLSKRLWYFSLLFMYVSVDALRLTGTTHNALYVHLTPLIFIAMVTYCSDEISNDSTEVLCTAVVFTLFTIMSSLHMLMTFRDRYHVDHQLRQRMAKEAEMMGVAKDVEVAQRQASQKADTMLNHILKNIMAEAHGCIDLFFGQRDGEGGADDHLHRAQESLERGMRWCKKRQVMVQVNSGDYTPILAPTNLRKLVDGIVYGRDITVDTTDVTVCLDSLLCEVVLDNAISNAFRHGDMTLGPISLVVSTRHGCEHPLEVTFTLTNYVPEDHPPVTPEVVKQLAAGNDVGLANVPALSDHLGLRHMFMAAEAHGMTTSLEQVDNLVMFTASLEVDLDDGAEAQAVSATTSAPLVPSSVASFPPGLRIICLDDSEIARRVLIHGFATHAPQTICQAYGATVDELVDFQSAALSRANIVVLDQHLDYHHVIIYGTDIAQCLRQAGYGGFICVRSANATDEDELLYLRCGADCTIGKDIPLRDMVRALELAYEKHMQARWIKPTKLVGEYCREEVAYVGSMDFSSIVNK